MSVDTSAWLHTTYTATTSDIRGLILHTQANYVVQDPSLKVATITFRTDSEDVQRALRISETTVGDATRVIKIDFSDELYGLQLARVQYIVDIALPTNTLSYLDASGDTVVGPRVLTNTTSSSIDVRVRGSGDVFLQDASLIADRLSFQIAGSGDLQVNIPSTRAAAVEALLTGSGDFSLFTASLDTKALDINTEASGTVFISGSLEGNPTVTTRTFASGDISYALTGSCTSHEITVTGSGDADTSSLACASTVVTATGSGDVYAAATTAFASSKSGSGDVNFVGPTALKMTGKYHTQPYHQVPDEDADDVPPYVPATMYRGGSHSSQVVSDEATDGISLGAVVLLLILGYCFFRNCCKKRRQYEQLPMVVVVPSQQQQYNYQTYPPSYQSTAPVYTAPPQLIVPPPQETYGKQP
ncbi:hypothetical protein ACHHYP_01858 [Achlya hypogyna]|uniref:Putative auto-transporter adhesin head GIN domain-containing protein n=1 Tax=Achlya hypogyna TaxID=1202772 RepID=A0A1V9Z7W3_ACHHY|nr:hypothetical protein ACHHYP_01858 [Achlya hypogyna]